MHGLGASHIEKIKHKFVELDGPIKGLMGRPKHNFTALISGPNGSGKTRLYFHIAEQLQLQGRVDIFSYEQRHGPDMQKNLAEFKVRENKWDMVVYDPFKGKDPHISHAEALYRHLEKPKSAKFVIIDSVDACEFDKEDYFRLNERFGDRKAFIWLSFEGANKKPLTALARHIVGMGDYYIRVNQFIAKVEKSRYGGWEDFVIWEEKARILNPLYFAPPVVKKGKKKKA